MAVAVAVVAEAFQSGWDADMQSRNTSRLNEDQMKSKFATFSLFALALGVSACTSQTLTTAETDQVLTIKVPEQDYFALRTYLLPTEVTDLCQKLQEDGAGGASGLGGMGGRNFVPDEDCRDVDHKYDSVAIQAMRENLDHLGYREILASELPDENGQGGEVPDVVFLMGWVARDNWYVSYSYPYCSGYNYYYYGCWYGGRSYAYNLPTGTLLVDMAVTSGSQASEFTTAWTMAFQGLLSTSTELSTERRIERGVNQGFAQSPYLADGGGN